MILLRYMFTSSYFNTADCLMNQFKYQSGVKLSFGLYSRYTTRYISTYPGPRKIKGSFLKSDTGYLQDHDFFLIFYRFLNCPFFEWPLFLYFLMEHNNKFELNCLTLKYISSRLYIVNLVTHICSKITFCFGKFSKWAQMRAHINKVILL